MWLSAKLSLAELLSAWSFSVFAERPYGNGSAAVPSIGRGRRPVPATVDSRPTGWLTGRAIVLEAMNHRGGGERSERMYPTRGGC